MMLRLQRHTARLREVFLGNIKGKGMLSGLVISGLWCSVFAVTVDCGQRHLAGWEGPARLIRCFRATCQMCALRAESALLQG